MAVTVASGKRGTFKGTSAVDTFIINDDTKGATITNVSGGDIIAIEGFAADFTAKVSGRVVTLTSTVDTALVIKFQLAATSGTASVRFLDGDLTATYTAASKSVTLGAQKLTAKAAAVSDAALGASDSVSTFDETAGGGSSSTGTTFTLTTGVDTTLTGGAGNDTFNGLVDQATAANQTMNATDIIDAGAGTDTLNVTGVGTTLSVLGNAIVSNFETINIRASTANSLDASAVAGDTLTQVNSTGAGTVLVNNLKSGAHIGIVGNGSLVQGEVAFSMATATDAVTVDISGGVAQVEANDGVTAAATIAAGDATGTATTATINSSGAANTTGVLDLANATLTAVTINATTALTANALSEATNQVAAGGVVTITGAGLVTLSAALDNSIAVINAATSTGGLSATLGTLGTISVTGGSGADTITTTTALTGAGKIDGGAGNDILVVTNTLIDTAVEAARFVNFETIRTNGTLNMATSLSGVTAIQLTAATNSVTNMTATQAANVKAQGTTIGASTFGLIDSSGTSDALTVTLGTGLTTAAAAVTGILTVSGFETVNLVENGGATATVGANRTSTITGAIVDSSLATVNLTGRAFNLTDISNADGNALAINGSALTGDGDTVSLGLTVAGSASAGSVITGSAVADRFTIGAEGSTYTGGAGNDGITTTAAILAADGVTDGTIVGGLGTDTLTLTGALTLTDNNFTNVSGMEALASAATTAVSYTGFGAATKAAFADGMTVTTGTLANGATYTFASGLYDKAVTLTLVTDGDGASAADNVAITTGAGADTISVTAASFVGHATDGIAGGISISTGAGADSITFSTGTLLATGTVSITGGTGADTINATSLHNTNSLGTTYNIASGDSTVAARDVITGFDLGTAALLADSLNLDSTTVVGNTAGTDGTDSGTIKSHAITSGIITFDDQDAFAAAVVVNATNLANVLTYVAANTSTNGTVAFAYDSDSSGTADATMVFQNLASDVLVELVGVVGLSITATNATTAGLIDIG